MDEREIEEILKSIPAEEPRSQLEPYRELILRLRRQDRPYQRILDILNEKFSVQVAYATLYDFIQRRSRPREEKPVVPSAHIPPTPTETPAAQPATFQPRPRRSEEEKARLREQARAENHVPAYPVAEDTRPVFHYDPNRPLSNKPPATKEEE